MNRKARLGMASGIGSQYVRQGVLAIPADKGVHEGEPPHKSLVEGDGLGTAQQDRIAQFRMKPGRQAHHGFEVFIVAVDANQNLPVRVVLPSGAQYIQRFIDAACINAHVPAHHADIGTQDQVTQRFLA